MAILKNIVLTEDQQIRKNEFEHAKNLYEKILRDHRHVPYNGRESYICQICGIRFGWACPTSPDHACHYLSYGNQIYSINGICFSTPENHNAENESMDSCIFCGDPEERK